MAQFEDPGTKNAKKGAGTQIAASTRVQTPSLNTLIAGPLSAVQGAVDTVKYASAFVSHAASDRAGLRADDDERTLIPTARFGA